MMICPVCSTENEASTVNCKTCGWHFPLKDTPNYHLELSRATQNFQMVSSFDRVFQQMKVHSTVMEKMNYRLDGLENDLKVVKETGYFPDATASVNEEQEDYPELEEIEKAEDFDTYEKQKLWWEGLEEQWQKAFNAGLLQKEEITDIPSEEELASIFDSPVLRLVGPRGMNPNVSFELTNLSGVKHLTNLEYLFCTHHSITNLGGIEHLSALISLFCNSNKLTSIKEVYYLPQLTAVYCNANQITSIQAVHNLVNLEVLYCCYNQLTSFTGIVEAHSEKLVDFYSLPNDKVPIPEIKKVEALGISCSRG